MKNIILLLLLILAVFGCKNPAPDCSEFCKYKITLLNNEYNKREFGYNGFSNVCGTYSEPLDFELWATITKDGNTQELMLFDASNITLNQQGKTNKIQGICISQSDAKYYANAQISFQIRNVSNAKFLVYGNVRQCNGSCILYYISNQSIKQSVKVNKSNCSIEIKLEAKAYKNGTNYACTQCNCNATVQ